MSGRRPLFACATEFEQRGVARALGRDFDCAILGIGPVSAAAEAAFALALSRPEVLVLFGLAGSYDLLQAPLGSVHEVGAVELVGVGVGADPALHQPLESLSWPRLAVDPRAPLAPYLGDPQRGPRALTVCASSADPAEAELRRRTKDSPLLEEMEGYAVAWASARAGVPFVHLRAVSNAAGDRDHARWNFEGAFAALAKALLPWLHSGARA